VDDIVKIFIPAALTFAVGIFLAPLLTRYLYAFKVWKKSGGKTALDGTPAVEFERLRTTFHAGTETKTPRMGGMLIWVSTAIVTVGIWLADYGGTSITFQKLDFLSRSQTWIPLLTLVAGGLVGCVNDILDVLPGGERGIRLRTRLLFVLVVSFFI